MKSLTFIIASVLFGLISQVHAEPESVLGLWLSKKEGKASPVVELYLEHGKLQGRVVDFLLSPDESEPVCNTCDDERQGKSVRGMKILSGFKWNGEKWVGGRIFSPERNKEFNCELWREGEVLKLHVSAGFISQTKVWYRR
ncbi:hypothetical protein R50073_26390 [Maricurvus nonylphenolicus]|uniref:DUF2147 domain-containing protein n=1 Tax=Maricurvus nonylphenolicus TaxID=1008307 RepID=UPI0036F2E246